MKTFSSLLFHSQDKLSCLINANGWVLPLHPSLRSLFDTIISIPLETSSSDKITWKNLAKVSTSLLVLHHYCHLPDVSWWQWVWHKHFAILYFIYTWLTLHNTLKMADALASRNIVMPPLCSLCNAENEMVNHLFFSCSSPMLCSKGGCRGLLPFCLDLPCSKCWKQSMI